MNPTQQARLHVQSLLARGVTIAAAREPLGVTGVSEIWGGVEPRDKAGWYVWLQDRPGAFGLDLEGAEAESDRPGVRAQLALRYYPSPTAPAFPLLSEQERGFVTSGWMDATGAPDVHRAASIPGALFLVGALELAFGEGVTQAVSLGAPARIGEVPAWEIALPLFTAIVGFVAQSERRSVMRFVETSAVTHRSAIALFDPSAGVREGAARWLDPDAVVVEDDLLCAAAPAPGPGGVSRVHATWFAGATAVPQQLGCCR